MCDSILIIETQHEVASPRELREVVGPALCPPNLEDPSLDDCCLCHTDVEGILTAAGYSWQYDWTGWYYAAKDDG